MTGSAATADVRVMTEAEMAAMRAEEGARVAERDGRFWVETFRGFYQPIHQLGRHAFDDVTRPTSLCWGYRSALVEEDASRANGALPVHLQTRMDRLTEESFEESRRRDLRKCRKQVEIVRRPDPGVLVDGGWQVYRSAKERVPVGRVQSEHEYREDIELRAQDPRRIIVAGLIDGRVAGYMESYAVDGVFYGRDLYVATEATKTGIATGLYLETFRIAAAIPGIHSLCLGPVHTERPGLGRFKKMLGIPEVNVPARVVIPAPIRLFMRRSQPATYYRITGHQATPPTSAAAPDAPE